MKKSLLYLGLSLIVSFGVWTNRLPAQTPSVEVLPYEPTPRPTQTVPSPQLAYPVYGPQVFVAPTIPFEPDLHPPYGMPFAPPPPPLPAKHFYRRVLNHFGMGCQANTDGNCGNIYSDSLFIFGSSRAFFGEVCVPNQHGQHQTP